MGKRYRDRSHEYVCKCDAYEFPHRMFGGRCTGQGYADEYWLEHYGSGLCRQCNSFNSDDMTCDVYDMLEKPIECDAIQDLINTYEIST